MTTEQTLLFATWAGFALVAFAALYWIVPTLARVHFLKSVDQLRDEAMDLVLRDELPWDNGAVQRFIAVQECFQRRSREITLARSIMYDIALKRMRLRSPTPPSMNRLAAEQRKLVHDLEARSKRALMTYLAWGSPMGFAMLVVFRALSGSFRNHGRKSPSKPGDLARETYDLTECQVTKGASAFAGRRMAPALLLR